MRLSEKTEQWLLKTVYGQNRDVWAWLARYILIVLSYAYRASIFLYLLPFKLKLRKKKRLPCPVVSVGNLTVGGTGKTPTVRMVCDGLIRLGYNPAVLSYGYGGRLAGEPAVVSDGKRILLSPYEAGDEPVMLARQLHGVAVLIGKDRYGSGMTAIRDYGADVLVLDDGLQVWKLERDLDIVLVDADNPFDNGRCLPAGQLRQPPSVLREADCVVVTGRVFERREQEYQDATSKIKQVAPDTPLFFSGYVLARITRLEDEAEIPAEKIKGRRVFTMCSIAKPESFERTVEGAGAVIVGRRRFRDHYLYRPSDVRQVCEEAAKAGAEYVATTEKDKVKIPPDVSTMPIVVLQIRMFLDDEHGFWNIIKDTLVNWNESESKRIGEWTTAD